MVLVPHPAVFLQTLTELYLNNTGITEKGAEHLSGALANKKVSAPMRDS
jgi:hypothetical protein